MFARCSYASRPARTRNAAPWFVVLLAVPALAQTPTQPLVHVIAGPGTSVPGVPGVVWGNARCRPALADDGRIVFESTIEDGVTFFPYNLAIGTAAPDGTVRVLARAGDPAPSLPGATLSLHLGPTYTTEPSIRSDGVVYWSDVVEGLPWQIAECVFASSPAGVQIVIQSGQVLPTSLGGAILDSPSLGYSTADELNWNASGRLLITGCTHQSTIPAENGCGLYTGLPAALEAGISGAQLPAGTTFQTFLDLPQMNRAGEVFCPAAISTLANPQSSGAVFVWTPGLGPRYLARYGEPVPGLPAGNVFAGTEDLTSPDWAWWPEPSQLCFNNRGEAALSLYMRGPDVTPGVDDWAVFVGAPGNLRLTPVRRGTIAPGTSAQFDEIVPQSLVCNDAGEIAFFGILRGPGISVLNRNGLWAGYPGALRLIARNGEACPLVPGAVYGGLEWPPPLINALGQVLLHTYIGGPSVTPESEQILFVHDPVAGPTLLARSHDQIEIAPFVFRHILRDAIDPLAGGNGDGHALAFNRQGKVAVKLGMETQETVIAVVDPHEGVELTCFGDGIDASHATNCPCGNFGGEYRGCANSVDPLGARLRVSGRPAHDDVVLHAADMPTSVACVFFQGDGAADQVFGDGVRCVGGNIVRLRVTSNSDGASAFPLASDATTLSARGGVSVGSGLTRSYQVYFRDAAAAFCPPAGFNITNGVRITW